MKILTLFHKNVKLCVRILCGFQKIYLVWGVWNMKKKILLLGIGALVLVTAMLVTVLTKKSSKSRLQKG